MVTAISDSQLDLTWTANTEPDVGQYNVYKSETSGGEFSLIGSSTTNSYSDTGLEAETIYHYTVEAVETSDNVGEPSDPASDTTLAANTTAPGGRESGLSVAVASSA